LEKIIINTPGSYSEILVGEKWETAFSRLPDEGVVIITDDNVRRLYGHRFPRAVVLSVPPGEESKKLEVISHLSEKLLESGIDRSGFILAVGGGVVCDLAGFLAAIYLRGIRCGYISTTVLSQVDASTGGKNGVNLGGTKNILGVIRQPEFVICDPEILLTLPEDEYLSGLSEMIKTAIIGDEELFGLIEENYKELMAREQSLLSILIGKSVKFKASVVSEDENEKGLRRILNFGHTFGHAVEMQKSVKHGFAVASGMELAAEFSLYKGFINEEEKLRITGLLRKFGLLEKLDIPVNQIDMLIRHDKKKSGNDIHFVFTRGIGKTDVIKVSLNEILEFYNRFMDKNL
jgi:3-dehydroquinate synthase